MNKFRLIKFIFIFFAFSATFFGIALLGSVPLRNFILDAAERFILHRSVINREVWHNRLMEYSISFFLLGALLFGVCIGRTLERIAGILRNVFLETRKIFVPRIVILFACLCLFLFVYVRLNINIMPVIVCWIACRLGFFNWLEKTFGKKETKTALIIFGVATLFFIVIMLLFKCTIVWNVFYGGDQNRVFDHFTQASVSHNTGGHPFYVIIWQSLYHLFRPLTVKTSLAIRVMVAIFAGLNVGMFSLFVSRLTKNRVMNILLCAVMAFSFPQIAYGSQVLESFIFTQTSLLVMILYFSFSFSRKEYSLPTLLAVALFAAGNNIAYACIFGIFYLVLLYRTQGSFRGAWSKIGVFSVWFIVVFSVLLLVQLVFFWKLIFYTPTNIVSMVMNLRVYRDDIAGTPISWGQYAKNFFGVMLFEYLPVNIGAVFNHGWVWAVLLVLPFLFIKKITHRPLFFAVTASCVFLFVFHRFFGINELVLYTPVLMGMFVILFAFIGEALPGNISASICALLLAVMIPVNALGTYTVHRINRFVFGTMDIVDWYENWYENRQEKIIGTLDISDWHKYDVTIEELKKRVDEYKGNRLFLFKALRETETWP